MTLGSTQPLREMSTRNISRGKGGQCVGLRTLSPSCAECLEIWETQPPGIFRACPEQTFFFIKYLNKILVAVCLKMIARRYRL